MIIACPFCEKKFEIDAALIPSEGRNLKCGSCSQIWFYKKEKKINDQYAATKNLKNIFNEKNENSLKTKKVKSSQKIIRNNKKYRDNIIGKKNTALIRYENKINFTLGKFLSYVLVCIISFIAFMIILDTFKSPLYSSFPNLEILVFNFYETLKDISLFIKDLS